MPVFPKEELKVIDLAKQVRDGIEANPDIFVTPPSLDELKGEITACETARQSVADAKAAYANAVQAKDTKMKALTVETRALIEYATSVAKGDRAVLKLIGWDTRKPPAPQPVPGQPRDLLATRAGAGHARLSWRSPVSSASTGSVRNYRILRADTVDAPHWEEVSSTTETSADLWNQPQGKQLVYSIVAANSAGDSIPSNAEVVIL